MTKRTDSRRHIPAQQAIAGREAAQEAVQRLRTATRDRGIALAKWNSHRPGCPVCEALQPGCDPGAPCHTGRPLLARLRHAHGRAVAARDELAPQATRQLDLFA